MAVENLQPLAYIVITVVFALGTASIFLRLYCRWRLRTFGRDDVAAIFLFCVNNVQQAILYMFLHYGCGLRSSKIFLLFYLRLSPKRSFQWTVYGTMVMCVVFLTYPNVKRLSEYVVQMVPTALNAFTDVVILILPVPTVLNLQMSTRRRIAVLGIICFGSLSVVTALCRFFVQKQLIYKPDTSYIMGRMVIVAGIEIEVAVVAVNLPAFRSLFSNLVGSSHEASSYDQYSHNQRGAHRLSSLRPRSQGPRKGLTFGSRKSQPRTDRGATLTGSEEELMRQQGSSTNDLKIHVVTKVDVASHQADDSIGVNLGLPSTKGKKHVHARE
ncbi:uncharacterized protein BDV17DRAFT_300861 [Aspergillus undulatus]|uniref:uncharacterized protein n=1 Tax=Aspergillus undulatus TaxID=1810928 RepID=UPI003CCDDA77